MTDFTYSTELSIQGPWLLTRSSLEELDQIFEGVWVNHQDRREKSGEFNAYRNKRSAVIEFGPAKSLKVETIHEAIGKLAASDERPDGIRVSMTIGELDASVSVGQPRYERDTLQVRVSPETTSESRELFGSLRQWAITYQPPMWQRIWARIGWILWVPWIFVLLVSLAAFPNQQRTAQQVAGAAADTLLRDGLTPDEMPAAIELMLRLETGRVVLASTPEVPRWFWMILVVGLFAIIVLQIRPKAVIGMGSGEEMIHRWRTWLRIVGVTVPSAILGSVVLPYLVDAVRRFLQP